MNITLNHHELAELIKDAIELSKPLQHTNHSKVTVTINIDIADVVIGKDEGGVYVVVGPSGDSND